MEALKKLFGKSLLVDLLLCIGITCIFVNGFLCFYCIAMWFGQGGWFHAMAVFTCFINACGFGLVYILDLKLYEADRRKAIS